MPGLSTYLVAFVFGQAVNVSPLAYTARDCDLILPAATLSVMRDYQESVQNFQRAYLDDREVYPRDISVRCVEGKPEIHPIGLVIKGLDGR